MEIPFSLRVNFEFFSQLAEVGREYGVVICFENMPYSQQPWWMPAELATFAASFESDYLKVCLDTGHSQVGGISPADAVWAVGNALLPILHIHDNDGLQDLHMVPFDGVLDWEAFASSLVGIGYQGALALESKVPKELDDAARLSFFRKLKKSLVRLESLMSW